MPVRYETIRQHHTADLLYDRDCGFCVKCLAVLRRIDRHDRVRIFAAQEQDGPSHFGIDIDRALEQVHAIDSRADTYAGAAAINVAFGAAIGSRIPLLIYRIPGIRQLQDRIYRWVATNRHRLPGKGGSCALDGER